MTERAHSPKLKTQVHKQLQYDTCNGYFYVSSWLGYSTQLFNQTLNINVAIKVSCRCD